MSKKNFTIDAAYAGYVYVGHAQGNFENDKGEKQSYFNIYVISPCSNYQSEDYMVLTFLLDERPGQAFLNVECFTNLTIVVSVRVLEFRNCKTKLPIEMMEPFFVPPIVFRKISGNPSNTITAGIIQQFLHQR